MIFRISYTRQIATSAGQNWKVNKGPTLPKNTIVLLCSVALEATQLNFPIAPNVVMNDHCQAENNVRREGLPNPNASLAVQLE